MAKKTKKRVVKQWFTIAYFTREGAPHPAHAHNNFVRVYGEFSVHLETMVRVMSLDYLTRGAYAGAIWSGQLSEWDALHGDQKPLVHVYEGGRVEEVA